MPSKLSSHSYGKSAIRLTKVRRLPDRHELVELEIDIELTGDFAASYLTGDNASIIATDTMKNTAYALAARHPLDSIEAFGLALAAHFVGRNPHVESAAVLLRETAWERLCVAAAPHPRAFVAAGEHRRTARVRASRGGGIEVAAGVEGLMLLKTGDSGFGGFLRDEFTTLKATADRIFATRLSAEWTYGGDGVNWNAAHATIMRRMLETFAVHQSLSVQQTLYAMAAAGISACPDVRSVNLEMPNRHRVPVNLEPFGSENLNEIFVPTDEPYGMIRAGVVRA